MPEPVPDHAEIASHYLRGRECLLLRASLEPVFVDYYLHLGEINFQLDPAEDETLKDLLAALALHAACRPRTERHAWTVHRPDWPRNFFASASNPEEEIVGRVFREDVAAGESSTIASQVQEGAEPVRTSVVALDADHLDVLRSAEEFYARSEQRPARFVRADGDDYLMLAAMPGSNPDWVLGLSPREIRTLAAKLEGDPLERRRFAFRCSCSLERIFPAIEPLLRRDADELFGEDEALSITCPRCARQYRLTREQAEAMIGLPPGEGNPVVEE